MLKKIGKKISFLNRIGRDISGYARCVVYESIIAPHFEYCVTMLASMSETDKTVSSTEPSHASYIAM